MIKLANSFNFSLVYAAAIYYVFTLSFVTILSNKTVLMFLSVFTVCFTRLFQFRSYGR